MSRQKKAHHVSYGFDCGCVGAPGDVNGGSVQAFSGASPHSSIFFADATTAIGGLQAQTIEYGGDVSGAGDFDHDGHPDIVVGARLFDLSGAAFDAGLIQILDHTGHSLSVVDGSHAGELYGSSVASVGDINLDGHCDVIVGARAYSSDSGRVEILSGCPKVPKYYGAGCPASNNNVPSFAFYGCPQAGNQAQLWIDDALPNQSAIVLLGLNQTAQPLAGGCSLLVVPILPIIPVLPLGPSGSIHIPLTFPTPLPAFTITMQAFVPDPFLALGFSNSRGVEVSGP